MDQGNPAKEAAYMFEVTEKANEKIQEFFKGKEEVKNIRIFLSQGG
jgi:Fe-S cluster assembly iron-binding protein IscA